MPSAYLIDTNVLLRLALATMEQHLPCRRAVDVLYSRDHALHFTLQNATEFWNVATRPLTRNGYGRSPDQTASAWQTVEKSIALLPDDIRVYDTWLNLVETHQIRGVQVHDARLAAAMLVHNVSNILTLNTADFARFPGLNAVHPQEV